MCSDCFGVHSFRRPVVSDDTVSEEAGFSGAIEASLRLQTDTGAVYSSGT